MSLNPGDSINSGQYKLVKKLGNGSFGEVWQAQGTADKHNYALKFIKVRSVEKAYQCSVDDIEREAENFCKLDENENVVRYYGAFRHTPVGSEVIYLVVVMELVDDNLTSIVQSPMSAKKNELIAEIMKQLCKGVEHMHDSAMIHSDLKLDNVGILRKKGKVHVRILDLGLCQLSAATHVLPRGHQDYRAPECFGSKGTVGVAMDCWAVGCILVELVLGIVLCSKSVSLAANKEVHTRLLRAVTRVDATFGDIASKLLEHDPAKRMTAADAVASFTAWPNRPRVRVTAIRIAAAPPKKSSSSSSSAASSGGSARPARGSSTGSNSSTDPKGKRAARRPPPKKGKKSTSSSSSSS